MANTNKLKFTVWTNSGTRVEMSTGPLLSGTAALVDLLTPEQLDKLQTYVNRRVAKLKAAAVSKGEA